MEGREPWKGGKTPNIPSQAQREKAAGNPPREGKKKRFFSRNPTVHIFVCGEKKVVNNDFEERGGKQRGREERFTSNSPKKKEEKCLERGKKGSTSNRGGESSDLLILTNNHSEKVFHDRVIDSLPEKQGKRGGRIYLL